MANHRKKIIVVTDGDQIARKTIEVACKNLGLRCISMSAGNPTPLTPEATVDLILQAKAEPVVVMVDDRGEAGEGRGERILKHLAHEPRLELMGVVAVASNAPADQGVPVDFSVTQDGEIYPGAVDKEGLAEGVSHRYLAGDTVGVLNQLDIPVIIGIGDIGKMDGQDSYRKGAPNTTLALQQILERSGYGHGQGRKS